MNPPSAMWIHARGPSQVAPSKAAPPPKPSKAAAPAASRGQSLHNADPYVVSDFIGRGTFGDVYLATRQDEPGAWALKVLKRQGHEGELRTWKREADLMAAMEHDNVVKLLHVFWPNPGENLVFVFPLADMDLRRFLRRRDGIVGEQLARQLAREIACGLAHIHEKGAVHRDLKPENVFLTVHDDGPHLQIGDFGMARLLPQRAARTRLNAKTVVTVDEHPVSRTCLMTGVAQTLWYRAPEILLNMSPTSSEELCYGAAVDVWSWGCVSYELVMEHPLARAWDDVGVVARLTAVLGPPPEDLSYGNPRQAALVRAAQEVRKDRLPLDHGRPDWDALHGALKWEPASRLSMRRLLREAP